jgi:hypothetical protein
VFSAYFAGNLPYSGDAGADAAPPPSGDAGSTPSRVGKSILDYALADLNRFQNIVGAADKVTIQNHMQYVRNIEATLQGLGTGGGMDAGTDSGASTGCGTTAAAAAAEVATATASGNTDISNTSNVPTLLKLDFDMAAAAFAADMTRVVVCQCGDQGDANLVMTWLGFMPEGPLASDPNLGDPNGYHAIARANGPSKVICDTWFQQQLAYMIGNMKGVTDMTGASILDNSLFLAMNNMRTGAAETTGVPVVMAGGLGGYFKTGQSLAPSTGTRWTNNQLLMTILNGFGYGPFSAGNPFGTAEYCLDGPLTELLAT